MEAQHWQMVSITSQINRLFLVTYGNHKNLGEGKRTRPAKCIRNNKVVQVQETDEAKQ